MNQLVRSIRHCSIVTKSFTSSERQRCIRLSSTTQHLAASETRLAGRQRLYKVVGTANCPPPWKTDDRNKKEDTTSTSVASPISAGVDGTQSATGVSRRSMDAQDLQSVLSVKKEQDDWFTVTLDDKPLKTPLGQPLAVPSLTLATALAVEWNQQTPYLSPAQMPLMTLVCTSLDQTSRQMEVYQLECLKFVATDTICYWEDPLQERALHRRQEQHWQPIYDLVEQSTGHALARTFGTEGLIVAKNTAALPHPPELYEFAQSYVAKLNSWELTLLHSITAESKSFWLGWALLSSSNSAAAFTVDQAVDAARVEEEYQIHNWGLVEGGHDYDRLNSSIQLRAAAFMRDSLVVD